MSELPSGAGEVGASDVGTGEVGAVEVSAGEIGVDEIGDDELGVGNIAGAISFVLGGCCAGVLGCVCGREERRPRIEPVEKLLGVCPFVTAPLL